MISRTALLASLLPVSKKLEQDLRQQLAILPDAKARLHADWQAARAVKRTAQAFEVFVEDQITQVAVAWILSAVFVRFLEDNGLVDAPLLSGPLAPQNRLQLARDRHTLYFRENPRHSDVHYLKDVFARVGKLPGLSALFDPVHNPLWLCDLSPDGATLLLAFFQQVGPGGDLQADFTDPKLNTRFLATCIKTCPSARASSLRCFRPPSLSKSSSWIERWNQRLPSLVCLRCGSSIRPAVRATFCWGRLRGLSTSGNAKSRRPH